MDLGIVGGIVMLAGWAIATFMFEAPGWVHLFLTLGVTILVWRVVARGTPSTESQSKAAKPPKTGKRA